MMGIPIGPVDEGIDSRTLDLYSRNENDEEREEIRREIRDAVRGITDSRERTARNEGSLDRRKQDVLPERKVFDAKDPRTEKDDMKPLRDPILSHSNREPDSMTDLAGQRESELRQKIFDAERNRNYGAVIESKGTQPKNTRRAEDASDIVRTERSGERDSRRFEDERIRDEFQENSFGRTEERIPERWGTERSVRPEYAPMFRPDETIFRESEKRADAERRSEELRNAERTVSHRDVGAPEHDRRPDRDSADREGNDATRRNSRRKDELRSGIDIAERERLLSSGRRKSGQFRNRDSFMRIRRWRSR